MMMMLVQESGAASVAPPQNADGLLLNALVSQQLESVRRLVQLEGDRVTINKQLASATGEDAARLRKQLVITESIIDGEKAKIADLKARIAEASHTVGSWSATEVPPPVFGPGFRDSSMLGLSKDEFLGLFILLITIPIMAAVTRRLWRRAPGRVPAPMDDNRLARLEQAVEAVAIEVERIGESQRFQAKLMAEKPQARKEPVPRVPTPV